MDSVSFDPEAVHLQMEEIKQEMKDDTFYYLVNIFTLITNILGTADDTIKYIKEFPHDHHYYSGPTTTPIS